VPQLDLRSLEHAALSGAEVVTGPIDVKRQHRHRGAIRIALSPPAALCRSFERPRNATRVFPRENAPIQIERIAAGRSARRPTGVIRVLTSASVVLVA